MLFRSVHCAKPRSQPCLRSFYRSTDHSTSFHHRPVDEETKAELPLREAPCSLSICLDLDHELLALLSSEHSREASLSCLTTPLAANSDSSRPYCNGTFQCRSNNKRANSRYRSSDGSGRGSRSSGCLVVVVVSLFALLGRCVAQRSTGRR